jgi:hypothetical protein
MAPIPTVTAQCLDCGGVYPVDTLFTTKFCKFSRVVREYRDGPWCISGLRCVAYQEMRDVNDGLMPPHAETCVCAACIHFKTLLRESRLI